MLCRVMEMLGTPPHPWQRDVADVALEYHPTTFRYHYSTAGICADRQAGKTTWAMGRIGMQLLIARQRVIYLSYDRAAGRVKWTEQVTELMSCRVCGERCNAGVEVCPQCGQPPGFASRVRSVTYQNQQECLTMRNGSIYSIATPQGRGGRSLSADLVILDEAFSFEDMRALGAIQPTLATRPFGQFLVLSSAGTAASVLLNHFRDLGHGSADLDDVELAQFGGDFAWWEWCPDPSDSYEDPHTWEKACPSIGQPGGPTWEAFATACRTLPRATFGREWLNITSDDLFIPTIPAEWWKNNESGEVILGTPTLAIAMTPERDRATLAASGLCRPGDADRAAVELLESSDDVDWVIQHAMVVAERQDAEILIDDKAPAGARAALLERHGLRVRTLNTVEVVKACGDMFDAIKAGRVPHADDYRLAMALEGAIKRKVGQGWVWQRATPDVDITSLDAVTLARWGAVSSLTPAVW